MPRIADINHICLWPPHCLPVLHRLQYAKAGAGSGPTLQCARNVSLVPGHLAPGALQVFPDSQVSASVINMDSRAYLASASDS